MPSHRIATPPRSRVALILGLGGCAIAAAIVLPREQPLHRAVAADCRSEVRRGLPAMSGIEFHRRARSLRSGSTYTVELLMRDGGSPAAEAGMRIATCTYSIAGDVFWLDGVQIRAAAPGADVRSFIESQ